MDTVSNRFAYVRDLSGLNKKQFADSINILATIVSDIESGKREPSKDVLIKLKEKWGVSIDWLLTGEGEMFLPGKDPSQGGKVDAASHTGAAPPEAMKLDTVSNLDTAPPQETVQNAPVSSMPSGLEPPKRIRRISMELHDLADELDVGGPVPARLRPLVRRVARLDDEDLSKTTAYVDDLLQKVKYAQSDEPADHAASQDGAEAGIA